MSERIVSPGVFTRERDLSFLPVGIGEIGAAIIGPTLSGPSFVPTVVTSFQDFQTKFGNYTTDFYTPYTVKEYFKGNASSVTIVKVGFIGGYKTNSFNLVANSKVLATFAPSAANNSGLGSISGSLAPLAEGTPQLKSFTLNLNGANATASADVQIHGGTADFLHQATPDESLTPKIGAVASPAYLYKNFSRMSSSILTQEYGASTNVLTIENVTDGLNFQSGGETVNSTTYVSTIAGNKDASCARTPMVIAQDSTDLFRIYNRVDGAEGNNYYVIISDISRPLNSNSSPEYAQFSLTLYQKLSSGKTNQVESYGRLNLDPTSPNFAPKVIGDQFQTVSTSGEVIVHGEYANLSNYIRIGDYNIKTFEGNKQLQPMGYSAVLEPIVATAGVPTSSFQYHQYKDGAGQELVYNGNIPYGFKVDEDYFVPERLYNNYEYMSAIPAAADKGQNLDFKLTNMKGFGDATTAATQVAAYTGFVLAAANLSVTSPKIQLKYAIPFQHGFDGKNPGITYNTGGDITATNVMGFDCSSSTKSGSVAYKRAIDTVSNPDEIDINMLVTPGIIHSLHASVTNHAIDKVEARADAFYVMDSAKWGDTVNAAVSNVQTLDTNYVATYFPWVKMDDPDTGTGVWVPPSVVIPGVIAFTDSVAHEWFAPAGLNRGGLTSVRMAKKKLTHTDRDTLYEGRVNPIATFPGQGVVVFGQKTLQAKPSALDRINVRRLLIRLKKFIASSSRYLVFEQNDSSTRSRFLNIVNPFLESVQSNSGLSAFKVVMDDTNNTPDVIDRNQMVGQIFIQPTRTAEFIVLDFSVLPTGAAFPE